MSQIKFKILGGPWRGQSLECKDTATCYTCGRPVYEDSVYQWHHQDPTVDYSEVYPREHPICAPPYLTGVMTEERNCIDCGKPILIGGACRYYREIGCFTHSGCCV